MTRVTTTRTVRQEYLALFANVSFVLFWLGQVITYLGNRIYQMVLLELVPKEGSFNRDAIMTYMGFFSLLPYILLAPIAGPTVDRYSRKAILVWSTLPLGVLLLVLSVVQPAPFVLRYLAEMIYLITLVAGGFGVFFFTAGRSLIPQIVDDRQLMAANSLSSFTGTLMVLVGTLAFYALAKLGFSASAMIYTGVVIFTLAAAMFAAVSVPKRLDISYSAARQPFLRKIGAGYRYVQGHRRVLKLIILSLTVAFLSGLVFAIVNGTLLGKRGLNWPVTHYALATGVLGVGMIAGAIGTTFVQKRIRPIEWYVACCFAVVTVIVLAFANLEHHRLVNLPRAVVLWKTLAPRLFIVGMCGGSLVVLVVSLLQRLVPRRFHGRVFALNSMCDTSALLLAMGLGGWLLARGMLDTIVSVGCVVSTGAIFGTLLSSESPRHRLLRNFGRAILKVWCRLQAEGRKYVPSGGPLIVASSHASWLDAAFVVAAVPRPVHFLVAREYYEMWHLKWIMKVFGAIPLERGKAQREPLKQAIATIRRGRAVGIFPEGRMSTTGEMQPLQGGVALLAEETGAPILPVAIVGNFEVMGPQMRFPHPYKVRVRIGPPIIPTGLSRDEILSRLEAALHRLRENA